MLGHFWFKMTPDYSTKMGRNELKEYLKVNKIKYDDMSESGEENGNDDDESDENKDESNEDQDGS
jgi:hypothetical protein